ncbi:MAG: DinB family protein, partial [Candidatus Eiseniibacteriota bacterium]
ARPLPKIAPPPAFPQAQGASARSQLMFRMVKARASVLASVQGMSAATAERPLAEGKWNTRETILHLVNRDQARLREMEAALRGVRPSWDGLDPARQVDVNEADLAPLRHVGWEDAKRLLLTTRQHLMEAVESIPEEPAEVWHEAHPLGWMFQRLPAHDLHHADIIKRWRTEQGA